MTEILEISYNGKLAILANFDLNDLRKLVPVKESGSNYIPDPEPRMTLHFGKTFLYEDNEVNQSRVDEAEERAGNLHRWWQEERAKNEKLKDEMEQIRLQLQQLIPVPKEEVEK